MFAFALRPSNTVRTSTTTKRITATVYARIRRIYNNRSRTGHNLLPRRRSLQNSRRLSFEVPFSPLSLNHNFPSINALSANNVIKHILNLVHRTQAYKHLTV